MFVYFSVFERVDTNLVTSFVHLNIDLFNLL